MKTTFLIPINFILSCSTPEYKVCEFEMDDKELKLYHDILTELIEHRFYNRYLGNVSGELEEKYPGPTIEFADTSEFDKDLILLQNKIFRDSSQFETICY